VSSLQVGSREQMRFQFSSEGLSVCSSFNVYWQPIPDAGAATEKARSPSFSLVRRVTRSLLLAERYTNDVISQRWSTDNGVLQSARIVGIVVGALIELMRTEDWDSNRRVSARKVEWKLVLVSRLSRDLTHRSNYTMRLNSIQQDCIVELSCKTIHITRQTQLNCLMTRLSSTGLFCLVVRSSEHVWKFDSPAEFSCKSDHITRLCRTSIPSVAARRDLYVNLKLFCSNWVKKWV